MSTPNKIHPQDLTLLSQNSAPTQPASLKETLERLIDAAIARHKKLIDEASSKQVPPIKPKPR